MSSSRTNRNNVSLSQDLPLHRTSLEVKGESNSDHHSEMRGHHEDEVDDSDRGLMTAVFTRTFTSTGTIIRNRFQDSTFILALLIVIIGVGISGAFIGIGVKNLNKEHEMRFEKQASELVNAVETTWMDYDMIALWIHEACHRRRSNSDISVDDKNNSNTATSLESADICSRKDFRELYEYVIAGGLEFQAMSFIPNVTDQMRQQFENEAAMYYREYHPDLVPQYFGFTGFEIDPTNQRGFSYTPRPQHPFYFPQHLIEPVEGNEHSIDFDTYSSQSSFLIDEALTTWKPIVSNPISASTSSSSRGRCVMLLHPGIKVSTSTQEQSTGLSSVTIYFSEFIKRASAVRGQSEPVSIYIFDTTTDQIQCFGGAHLHTSKEEDITFLDDAEISTIRQSSKSSRVLEKEISIEQQTWTVIVVAQDGTYEPTLTYVIIGGVLIFVACSCMALYFYFTLRRQKKIARIKDAIKAEKAALVVENAKKAAQSERELNDYLAHEVRNPLTAAMSSASFLSSSFQESIISKSKTIDESKQASIQEDISVIRSSLEYIHDLLRSMLDMHRTTSNQMKLEISHTDILKDVLEPVKTILHQYSNTFDINIDCPNNLIVLADRMRLKQVVLNLAANSKKFVQEGFITLRATVASNGFVELSVEDSGPGIPQDNRSKLFSKFQDSLDSLNQGTGMGLSLCKNLMELMGGDIILDESYDSGVQGYPGVRFILLMNAPPVQLESVDLDQHEATLTVPLGDETGHTLETSNNDESSISSKRELPETLSVLLVDDDLVLRKLLSRSLKRVAPGWTVQEAANGETALRLVDDTEFDLIFIDQYMASVDKQLLGTETAYALRAKGVTSRICGLSANNLEESFLKSGANHFLLKPFQCDKEALKQDLLRILE